MKHNALFLSIYLLCLAILPCMDIGLVCLEEHQESKELAHQHTSDTPESSDECPPFCYCSCCGSILLFEEINPSEKATSPKLHNRPDHACHLYNQSFPDAIFPPPRT